MISFVYTQNKRKLTINLIAKSQKSNKTEVNVNENKNKSENAVESYVKDDSFKSDPNGSWTGRPIDKNDKPEQDADDL